MVRPTIDQQITFLYTRDLGRTAHFYEQILALDLVLDQGSCRVYRVAGDAYLGFCERDEAPEEPKGILYTLVTDQVDAWYDFLVSQDVNVAAAPTTNDDYGIYHFFALDPNGYVIEVQRFLDSTWHELEAETDL